MNRVYIKDRTVSEKMEEKHLYDYAFWYHVEYSLETLLDPIITGILLQREKVFND